VRQVLAVRVAKVLGIPKDVAQLLVGRERLVGGVGGAQWQQHSLHRVVELLKVLTLTLDDRRERAVEGDAARTLGRRVVQRRQHPALNQPSSNVLLDAAQHE